jgi:hypothetical protein
MAGFYPYRYIGIIPMFTGKSIGQRPLEFRDNRAHDGERISGEGSARPNNMTEPKPKETEETAATPAGSPEVHSALIARLARLHPVPAQVRPPQSLQPTPEAAKTRAARLRRKQRLLLRKAKRAPESQSSGLPPAPDPLAP